MVEGCEALFGGSFRSDPGCIDDKIVGLKCVLILEGPLGLLDASIGTMNRSALDLRPVDAITRAAVDIERHVQSPRGARRVVPVERF